MSSAHLATTRQPIQTKTSCWTMSNVCWYHTFLRGSYLKTSTSLNLHLDILTPWLTHNHRNPPSQVDHQVISRAAKGFPARHNMWSPSRRGKPLALNVTSGTEKKPDWHLVVFDSTVDLKKKMWCNFCQCGSLCSHLCLQWASHCHLWDPQHWTHERHAPKLGTSPWAEFGTRDRPKIWGGLYLLSSMRV